MSDDTKNDEKLRTGGLLWVEFKGHRRDFFANPYEFPFRKNDIAIVEADRGEDAGIVNFVFNSREQFKQVKPEYAVIRRATSQDKDRIEWLHEREIEAFDICNEKIDWHGLPMKLVDTEYRFDGLKLIFYFTADGRVDFRELVRDLAGTFRTRIELRQIGARDEVKRFEGYGVCGYRLCCITHLTHFQPITTQLAKMQNLILNPSKLSGVCGKLKCCLDYEANNYEFDEGMRRDLGIGENGVDERELDDLSD
jgi:cell fate regulator YaaT (PSP1 superfamily)